MKTLYNLGLPAALAVVAGTAASAQEAPRGAGPDQADAADDAAFQDIVVTAQRRDQRQLDVPISVTAVSAEALSAAGVTSNIDLPLVTPGLRIDAVGVFVQPVVRGISSTVTGPGDESNVATYVDGVYQQSTVSAVFDLPDVEQVEVLKGPQGTLFGRNATGGAILIKTHLPDLVETAGQVSAGYGRFDQVTLKGFASLPLVTDKLAASLSAYYDDMDGYKRNLLDEGRRGAGYSSRLVRGKLRIAPVEGVDFVVSGLYSKRIDDGGLRPTNYRGNTIGAALDPEAVIASRPWTYSLDVLARAKREQRSITLHGDIDAGPGTLSTTTHYDRNETFSLLDVDNSPVPLGKTDFPAVSKNFQQEILYTTEQIGRFRAVGGLFLFSMTSDAMIDVNDFQQAIYWKDKADAFAIFGEIGYDVTDSLSLTGGLRYSHETRKGYAAAAFDPVKPALGKLGEKSWSAATPRVSLLYKATGRTSVYATFSQGFKAGTFNSSGLQTEPVNPEKVTAYEVGVKTAELRSLWLSAAAFYYDYSDMQVQAIRQEENLLIQTVSNAATARIYGAELTGNWRVAKGFDVTFGGTWLHSRYSRFPDASVNVPSGFGGNATIVRDVSGNTLIRSPSLSGNLTTRYTHGTDWGDFDVSGTLFYSGKVFFDAGNRVSQSPYALLSGSIAWQDPGNGLRLSLWGKNLTNRRVISSTIISNSYDAVDYAPPRTYGLEARLTF